MMTLQTVEEEMTVATIAAAKPKKHPGVVFPQQKKYPDYATQENFSWLTSSVIIGIHILGLALAPFTFTVAGLVVFLVLYAATTCGGVTFCYHRMLSHRSFKAVAPLRYFAVLLGVLSLQGGPIQWSATHRVHHAKSDKTTDPHSPVQAGFWWSHLLWNFFEDPRLNTEEAIFKLAPDLQKDPGILFMENYFGPINIIFAGLLFGGGYLYGGMETAISVLVWGGFLRIVAAWNVTWCINSVTHIFGYRNYDSIDNSKNLWWLAILAAGEGWHNNHHQHQRPARSGHRWYEIDITYMLIAFYKTFGLVYDVVPLPSKAVK